MRKRDGGMAVIETILFGLLLLVPLMWALGLLADLHRSALASSSAAREAGFDAAASNGLADAKRAVDEAVTRAFVDQGLDPSRARVDWNATSGLVRGGEVEVEVSYPVSVAQAPILGSLAGPSIWVNARHVARIDPFRSLE
ncbi:MAG: hypothetical protein H0V97_10725 [Actinobacteria bacterium]|nr:hypothetical protein [Actinomycetota bacterium]